MNQKKIWLVMALAVGMTVVGCDNGSTGGNGTETQNPGGNDNGTTGGNDNGNGNGTETQNSGGNNSNNDPSDNSGDTWSNVTSFSPLNGTWKPQFTTSTYNYKDLAGENGNSNMESIVGNMKVTVSYSDNYTITFNSTAKTMSISGTQTQTYSDGNINTVWPDLKRFYESLNLEGITGSGNDTNYSITMTYNNYSQTLTDENLTDIQINQNGTKIKLSKQIHGGIEVIYTKQ